LIIYVKGVEFEITQIRLNCDDSKGLFAEKCLMSEIRFLINEDCSPFNSSELNTVGSALDKLEGDKRKKYRNENTSAIANNSKDKLLIVSGPGTGKSYLFLSRIKYWLNNDPRANIIVTSFVKKLVVDLEADISSDPNLSDEQKNQTKVFTLHKYARSIIEKNQGTTEWRFGRHFRMIGQLWKQVVWKDVLLHFSNLDQDIYSWKSFEEQLHNNNFEQSEEWKRLKQKYYELCKYYNAAGFADLIIRARKALEENERLLEKSYVIVDEYQDFNFAEEQLIKQLTEKARGVLIVGDDDQVLYERLKSGKPTLIRNLYRKGEYAKAMLPFCGRSSYHISKCAEYYINKSRDSDGIDKIYLPLDKDKGAPKVAVVACAAPSSAVDYIRKFIKDHKTELDLRKKDIEEGQSDESYLLILTPQNDLGFYMKAAPDVFKIIDKYKDCGKNYSSDYYKVLNYYSIANYPNNNFNMRKTLYYETVSDDQVYKYIFNAMQNNINICETNDITINDILKKCQQIKEIIESESTVSETVEQLSKLINVNDKDAFEKDLIRQAINENKITELDHQEDEDVAAEEVDAVQVQAAEVLSIIGSKGLSADHVIIVGFDDVNMNYVTKNAFFVAISRARKSLHILTALKARGASSSNNYINQMPESNMQFKKYKKTDGSLTNLSNRNKFVRYLSWLNQQFGGRR